MMIGGDKCFNSVILIDDYFRIPSVLELRYSSRNNSLDSAVILSIPITSNSGINA